MVPRVPQPGDVVAEKYEIVRMLGRGGMGVVALAEHRRLGTRVAIKFLMPDALASHDGVARFDREARAAALLRSPHVVRVHDVDTTADGLPFIVMEFLDGHDLGSEIRRRGIIPLSDAVDWMLQACIGLAEAHARGIVHRDIKPANLYLCREASGSIVKVMDFGVSKLLAGHGEVDLTTTETTVGTPSYMAPEQLLASRSIDHRADVWALGVVMYRMLTGALPFQGATPTALAIAIATLPPVHVANVTPTPLPPEVVAAIMDALEKDPASRPADVIAFGRALEPFGSKRVAFAAAVARMPPPHAAQSSGSLLGGDGTTRTAETAPVVDDMNEGSGTDRGWAKRAARAPVSPRRSAWPLALALAAGLIALVGAVAITLALGARNTDARPDPASSLPVAAAPSAVVPAEGASGEGAFAAPPASPEVPLGEPVASTAAAPSSIPRPAHPPANPRSTAPRPAGSVPRQAASAPPEDPLHL